MQGQNSKWQAFGIAGLGAYEQERRLRTGWWEAQSDIQCLWCQSLSSCRFYRRFSVMMHQSLKCLLLTPTRLAFLDIRTWHSGNGRTTQVKFDMTRGTNLASWTVTTSCIPRPKFIAISNQDVISNKTIKGFNKYTVGTSIISESHQSIEESDVL